jgi:hypothetical protein
MRTHFMAVLSDSAEFLADPRRRHGFSLARGPAGGGKMNNNDRTWMGLTAETG